MVFTLVITDFGIAKVIGGQFNVLATDAYKQVIGQQNFEMGAVVGFVLLVPAVLAFALDRHDAAPPGGAAVGARRAARAEARTRCKDAALTAYCLLVGGLIAAVLGVAVWASFITYWPYNLSLTLKNYDFGDFEPNGWAPYFASLQMAALAAVSARPSSSPAPIWSRKARASAPGGRSRICSPCCRWRCRAWCWGSATCSSSMPSGTRSACSTARSCCWPSTRSRISTRRRTSRRVTALKQIDNEFEAVSASLKVPF